MLITSFVSTKQKLFGLWSNIKKKREAKSVENKLKKEISKGKTGENGQRSQYLKSAQVTPLVIDVDHMVDYVIVPKRWHILYISSSETLTCETVAAGYFGNLI